jgi:hypothetical protein
MGAVENPTYTWEETPSRPKAAPYPSTTRDSESMDRYAEGMDMRHWPALLARLLVHCVLASTSLVAVGYCGYWIML